MKKSLSSSALLLGALWAALLWLPSCNVKDLSTQHARQIVGDWTLATVTIDNHEHAPATSLSLRFLADGTFKAKGPDGQVSGGKYVLKGSQLLLDDGPVTMIRETLDLVKVNSSTLEVSFNYEKKPTRLRFERGAEGF